MPCSKVKALRAYNELSSPPRRQYVIAVSAFLLCAAFAVGFGMGGIFEPSKTESNSAGAQHPTQPPAPSRPVEESSDEDPPIIDNTTEIPSKKEDKPSDFVAEEHSGSDDFGSGTNPSPTIQPTTNNIIDSPGLRPTEQPVSQPEPRQTANPTNTQVSIPIEDAPAQLPVQQPTEQPLLQTDVFFVQDQMLRTSEKAVLPNYGLFLAQQTDGNLVLYKQPAATDFEARASPDTITTVVWASGASFGDTRGDFYTTLQRNGNLLTRTGTPETPGTVVWKSNIVTESSSEFFLAATSDLSGMEIIEGTPSQRGAVLWSTSDGGSVLPPRPQVPPPTPGYIPDDGTVTYYPGNLVTTKAGILLSQGLDVRIIARKDQPVDFANGQQSSINFHKWPDAAACFPHPEGADKGYAYVSNSEATTGKSGVGAIYFDANHNAIDYKRLLTGTTKNCGGGKTPWGTWISCEEHLEGRGIWQCDPYGRRPSEQTALGDPSGNGRRAGMWESFSYDVRNQQIPRFFFTEDAKNGPVRRFTPSTDTITTDPSKMWEMLNDEAGTHEYLLLNPSKETFEWTKDLDAGRQNTVEHYQFCEGIDFRDGHLYFVSKHLKRLYDLDLDAGTYRATSTKSGTFSTPDQIKHLINSRRHEMKELGYKEREAAVEPNGTLLFGTEDGDTRPGIFAMDESGRWFSILEKAVADPVPDETTGLAFSPDNRRLFFCIQDIGHCYMVWRQDGQPFDALYLNVKHH